MKVIPNPKYKEALMMAKCPLCNKTMLLGGVIFPAESTGFKPYLKSFNGKIKMCLSCSNNAETVAGVKNNYDMIHPEEYQRKVSDAIQYVEKFLPSCQEQKLKKCLTATVTACKDSLGMRGGTRKSEDEKEKPFASKNKQVVENKKTPIQIAKEKYRQLDKKFKTYPNATECHHVSVACSKETFYWSDYRKYQFVTVASALNGQQRALLQEINSKSIVSLIHMVSVDKIIYFQEKGSLQYSSEVSGKTGPDFDAAGAVKGAFFFGTAGAIIGGMAGSSGGEITTKTIEHDDRYVSVICKNANGQQYELQFNFDVFSFLMKHIPEKEYSYYLAHQNTAPASQSSVNKQADSPIPKPVAEAASPFEEIKHFKELLDMGIITQEEFDAKKKQLLGL